MNDVPSEPPEPGGNHADAFVHHGDVSKLWLHLADLESKAQDEAPRSLYYVDTQKLRTVCECTELTHDQVVGLLQLLDEGFRKSLLEAHLQAGGQRSPYSKRIDSYIVFRGKVGAQLKNAARAILVLAPDLRSKCLVRIPRSAGRLDFWHLPVWPNESYAKDMRKRFHPDTLRVYEECREVAENSWYMAYSAIAACDTDWQTPPITDLRADDGPELSDYWELGPFQRLSCLSTDSVMPHVYTGKGDPAAALDDIYFGMCYETARESYGSCVIGQGSNIPFDNPITAWINVPSKAHRTKALRYLLQYMPPLVQKRTPSEKKAAENQGRPKTRKKRAVVEPLIAQHLMQRPHDKVQHVAHAVGCSVGVVAESKAWKLNRRRLRIAKLEGKDPKAIRLNAAAINAAGSGKMRQVHDHQEQIVAIDKEIDARDQELFRQIGEYQEHHPQATPEQVAKAIGCTAGDVERRQTEIDSLVKQQAEDHLEDVDVEDSTTRRGTRRKWVSKKA